MVATHESGEAVLLALSRGPPRLSSPGNLQPIHCARNESAPELTLGRHGRQPRSLPRSTEQHSEKIGKSHGSNKHYNGTRSKQEFPQFSPADRIQPTETKLQEVPS
jgi:hypothetical protein